MRHKQLIERINLWVMTLCMIVFAGLFIHTISHSTVQAADPPISHYQVRIIKVLDGDTVRADVILGFSIALLNESIRLQGFDAWETSRRRRTVTITDEELKKGQVAKKDLMDLLEKHKGRVYLMKFGDGRGVYGRLTGFLVVYPKKGDPIEIKLWMRERGHQRKDP